jgi:TonB family protein
MTRRRSSVALAAVLGVLSLLGTAALAQGRPCALHKNVSAAGETFYALKGAVERHIEYSGAAPEHFQDLSSSVRKNHAGKELSLRPKQHDYEIQYEKTRTGWHLRATPLNDRKGCGSFFVDEAGVIYFRREPGQASNQDPRCPARIVIGGNVQPARLLRQVRPEYPAEAVAKGIRGIVTLQVVIDLEGQVASVDVAQGDPILAKAAVDAVRQWRYQSTKLNGIPVEVAAKIDVRFGP